MKKLFIILILISATRPAMRVFAQTGNFSTVNLTGNTSGSTILSAPGAGRQEIALSNDFITGVDRMTFNDNGLGEGLIFTPNEVDISLANSTDDGFAGFMFRTNNANPFYFHSSGSTNLNINSTPVAGGLFNSTINFGSNRASQAKIQYSENSGNSGGRLNLINSTTGMGLHVGEGDTWMDKSLHIRTAAPNGPSATVQEILFQTGGTVSTSTTTNAMIYYSSFPGFGTNLFHLSRGNDFGAHIGNNDMYFGYKPQGGWTYEMFNFPGAVKASRLLLGNFGIPSSSFPADATFLLAVDGKMISEQCWIRNSSNWPDYVLKNDYQLKSLEEVEVFIKENSHLPEVPSAKELAETGINVGEMEATLLKKVEELTLYLIEANNEVKRIAKKVERLEEENRKLTSKQQKN